jgi:dTDP-4-amino-4,6-dideoxygalactose transaminase
MTVATQEIPLVDLRTQYATIRDEVRQAIDEVLEGMQLTIGPNVRAFDKEWAAYCGTTQAIGVGSGTDALQLAIRACGVSSGDEVITVSHTFFATVEAIVYANARPILVDVDERTMLMDIGSVASRITPRTKGDRPGPPLRPDRRPQAAAPARAGPGHHDHRGRRSGAWRPAR